MSVISFRIDGAVGTVRLDAFITAIENWRRILADVDVAVSGAPKGTLDWVITDMRTGSFAVSMEPVSRLEDKNFGPEVSAISVRGMGQLERDGTTPPYLSENGLSYARRLLKTIGNSGVTGIQVSYQSDTEALSARASANIDQLLPPRYTTLGSVVGRMEAISIHGAAKFVVYHDYTNKAVTCTFPESWLDRVKDALGKRVDIAGVVHWNSKNEPVRVEGDDLRILRAKTELPSIVELAGCEPGMTGDLTTEEYIRRMRANG